MINAQLDRIADQPLPHTLSSLSITIRANAKAPFPGDWRTLEPYPRVIEHLSLPHQSS